MHTFNSNQFTPASFILSIYVFFLLPFFPFIRHLTRPPPSPITIISSGILPLLSSLAFSHSNHFTKVSRPSPAPRAALRPSSVPVFGGNSCNGGPKTNEVSKRMIIGLGAITREIVLACREIGQAVSDVYAAYIASTIPNPQTGIFYIDSPLDENTARTLVELAVRKIFNKQDSSKESLRFQCQYECQFQDESKQLTQAIQVRDQEYQNLANDICEPLTSNSHDYLSITDKYKKINELLHTKFQRLLPFSKEEISAALESVLPRAGIRKFLSLSHEDKFSQLESLSHLVLGILLLNNSSPSSHSTPSPYSSSSPSPLPSPALLSKGASLISSLEKSLLRVKALTHQFDTALLFRKYRSDKEKEEWLSALIYLRSVLNKVTEVLVDSSKVQETLEEGIHAFQETEQQLHVMIQGHSTVSKEEMYPFLDALAKNYLSCVGSCEWIGSRESLVVLVGGALDSYSPVLPMEVLAFVERERGGERLGERGGLPEVESVVTQGEMHDLPVLLTEENTRDFDTLPLSFYGYCLWTFERRNVFISGKPTLGVVKYKNRFCVFGSENARDELLLDPEYFFRHVRNQCYVFPALIHLLKIHDDFSKSSLIQLVERASKVSTLPITLPFLRDASVSTITHPVQSNIDENYRWNEWDIRREAIRMTNVRKYATSEAQTLGSHFRRGNEMQVYLPKDAEVQSAIEKSIQTKTEKRMITGLRGDPKTVMKIVNLTLDL